MANAVVASRGRHAQRQGLHKSTLIQVPKGNDVVCECNTMPVTGGLKHHGKVVKVNIGLHGVGYARFRKPTPPLLAVVFVQQAVLQDVAGLSNSVWAPQQLRTAYWRCV